MDNNERQNFLAYINNPMSKESITILYSANNIRYEKCELYSDFVQSLIRLTFDTYMGDDITSIEQQIKHFKWCWDKNVSNFIKEGMLFQGSKIYNYFLEFMLEVFYSAPDKKPFDYKDRSILKIWYYIFDYNRIKTNSDMDTLIEIYNIFENSLKLV
jgi:hypothetical protein